MSKINTAFDQMSKINTALGQMSKINNTAFDQMSKVNTALGQMSKVNTAFDQIARVNNTALGQMSKVNTAFDQMSRVNNTALGQMSKINTALGRLPEFNTLQDVGDRISRFTTFSHNQFPFVEKYAEDLLKEKAVSNQKMTDEVKKQVEDLFKELENEEIADEVGSPERFWRKVVEGWGKIPDWSKNCLVIIRHIFQMCLSAYLGVLFQSFYQADNPTTIVSKPVIKIIKKAERQGLHLPSEYRIVTASKLNVRERPKRHSDIRGTLFAGDLVVIKKKKKNWSLVEYSNEETHIKIQGWIFTRYLRKIN